MAGNETGMVFRITLKLAKKIKVGPLDERALSEETLGDWSCHLFTTDRVQYVILSNTASLYSCIMLGRGIADEHCFVDRAISTIIDFATRDGFQIALRQSVTDAAVRTRFAKTLNRSVTGSMNDLVQSAKLLLVDHGLSLHDVCDRLNETPFKSLQDAGGRSYANPREVFNLQADRHLPLT